MHSALHDVPNICLQPAGLVNCFCNMLVTATFKRDLHCAEKAVHHLAASLGMVVAMGAVAVVDLVRGLQCGRLCAGACWAVAAQGGRHLGASSGLAL